MYDQPFYNGVGRLNVDVEEENHILFTYPSIFYFFFINCLPQTGTRFNYLSTSPPCIISRIQFLSLETEMDTDCWCKLR